MLKKHAQFLRILPDTFYENPVIENLEAEYRRIKQPFNQEMDIAQLAETLKRFHRTRLLASWHDTSCVSNASHFLILVNCLYDEALYYTSDEYATKTGLYLTYFL